jgi:redox-sensitive bicupin YhaK (pirin superfamily)
MSMTVKRAATRYVTRGDGWVGRYCFSYGEHYDAANISFGSLLACNEFTLEPGAGFGLHRHAGVDIVTVVLEGELTHVGAMDARENHVLWAGEVRHLRTEGGIEHDERNEGVEVLRFVQAWLRPRTRRWLELVRAGEELRVEGPAFVYAGLGQVRVEGVLLQPGDSVRSEQAVTVAAGPGATALAWTC